MLTVGQEGSPLIKINGGSDIRAVAFAANGEYLFSGGEDGVRVWRVEDGKQMATIEAELVWCLAVSEDGRWIAAGTAWGEVFVWDAKTYEKVFSNDVDVGGITGVDFSPDSTRLVSASRNQTATIWDIATRERVHKLRHGEMAAKYSSQGDWIATAADNITDKSVRIWDSNDGGLLMDIPVTVTPSFNNGLLWFNDHLFVVSGGGIRQIEVSTGLIVSEWPVPDSHVSCIALPKQGEFIICSGLRIVTFWDTMTHAQLGLIQHPQDIGSIAVSPDNCFLAIGGQEGEITINSLSYITVSILLVGLSCI